MLDLRLFARGAVRGSALLQTAVMVAMVGVSFASTQLFQYAWGWSPMAAGLGTLPLIAGMFLGAPLTDALMQTARPPADGAGRLRRRWSGRCCCSSPRCRATRGSRRGCSVLGLGMRLVMTTSAVALIEALPSDHTSLGSALNDTAQELGNSVGVAVIGTVTAAVMGATLPVGRWSAAVTEEFLHSQRIGFAILAGIVAIIAVVGGRTLTNSTTTEE